MTRKVELCVSPPLRVLALARDNLKTWDMTPPSYTPHRLPVIAVAGRCDCEVAAGLSSTLPRDTLHHAPPLYNAGSGKWASSAPTSPLALCTVLHTSMTLKLSVFNTHCLQWQDH